MIDIRNTLLSTITCNIDKLRLLAENDPVVYRKILTVIILQDILEWAKYLDDCEQIVKKLRTMISNYLYNNPEFILEETGFYLGAYTNVNIPQTNDTYKRVFDNPITAVITDITHVDPVSPGGCEPFTPDYTCPQRIITMTETSNVHMGPDGPEVTNWDLMTICDKMNLYIDPTTKSIYYLDSETCQFTKLALDISVSDQGEDVINDAVREVLKEGINVTHDLSEDQSYISATATSETDVNNINIANDLEEDDSWLK